MYIQLKSLSLKSLGQLCFLTDHSGWWIKVEEEEAVKIIQKRQKLLKFQIDLQVVEEGVVDEVETQLVFLVTCVSFSSFFVLQPNQLGAIQSDHGPLTSPELRTASCDLHELHRIWFPTCDGEESLSCGGGRRDVVVVIDVTVAVDVGSGLSSCDFSTRNLSAKLSSFSRCYREDRVPAELAGSSSLTSPSVGSLRFS
ncbi:hypothetical protein Tco_0325206 [Tanacetum coccineum]